MIEEWIDTLCAVWEISDQWFGTVKSFKLVENADFPESIEAMDLDLHPIALTFVNSMRAEYSVGGPRIGFYNGETEFHVAPDVSKARLPGLLAWYGKIVRAAAAQMTLSHKVEYFAIDDGADAISLAALKYGAENPHWGFVVRWRVKEKLNDLSVSA